MDPTGHKPDDISYRIWIGTFCTLIPATISVILRFISRYIARAGYWWDDWFILASLVINWAMAAMRWAQILLFGFGKHGVDLTQEDISDFQKSFLAVQILYFTNAVLTKSSLLLLYQRIFGVVPRFRWVLWISGCLCVGYFIACTIASIAGCSPVSKFWNRNSPGSCINEIAFFRWNGIANMLLDILLLLLPFPMVWRMRTNLQQKFLLSGIFLMGSFVCVVSLLRILSFNYANQSDPTYSTINSSTWSSIEQGVGILCACLPTLRPLRRLWVYRDDPSENESACSSQSQLSKATSRSRASSGRSGQNNTGEIESWDVEQVRSLPAAIYEAPSLFGSETSIPDTEQRRHSHSSKVYQSTSL